MASKSFEFVVYGSKGDKYQISIDVSPAKVTAFCSCPGGMYIGACKHVLQLLNADGSSLTDQSQVELLNSLTQSISGHPITEYVREWNAAKKVLDDAQQKVKAAKESLRKHLGTHK